MLLSEIPKVDFSIVDSGSQLVNIRQVLQTLDKVIYEPRRVLSSVSDVLLTLIISGDFLLAAGGTHRGAILVGHIVGVIGLRLVLLREEELDVPGEHRTLGTTREKELLLSALDIAEALLSARHMEGAQKTMLAVLDLIEANRQVAEGDGDCVTL